MTGCKPRKCAVHEEGHIIKHYQYLESDQDYKGFEFAKELVLVLPSVYPTSEDGEERVRCIFEENSITSLHDHCFVAPGILRTTAGFSARARLDRL